MREIQLTPETPAAPDDSLGLHILDSLNEARKVLVDEASSTLFTIARDVKIQVEFNPAVVSEYRLVGYENRMLRREDFNNDAIDAGEIGAGHTVSALYEITLAGSAGERIDPLRYTTTTSTHSRPDELAFIKLRYKNPTEDKTKLIGFAVESATITSTVSETSERYRFAAAVAGFAQLLRGGEYLDEFGYDHILELSRNARGKDESGYRGEFIQLVKLARNLGTENGAAIDTNKRDL